MLTEVLQMERKLFESTDKYLVVEVKIVTLYSVVCNGYRGNI